MRRCSSKTGGEIVWTILLSPEAAHRFFQQPLTLFFSGWIPVRNDRCLMGEDGWLNQWFGHWGCLSSCWLVTFRFDDGA